MTEFAPPRVATPAFVTNVMEGPTVSHSGRAASPAGDAHKEKRPGRKASGAFPTAYYGYLRQPAVMLAERPVNGSCS